MKLINHKNFDNERALYALTNAMVSDCTFSGAADGESALKEAKGVCVKNCTFDLRYPFWHCVGFQIYDSAMNETCRAPLWYAEKGSFERLMMRCPKALRECRDIKMTDCDVESAEFGWRCTDVEAENCRLSSEYIFFESRKLTLRDIKLQGKYSLQYVKDCTIENSVLDTKDCLWHAKNVTVQSCEVNGEYLGWYSEGLTFINCRITGTQPFCYCKSLKLVNCEMVDCDLAFEYSDVEADTHGHIISIKNPRSGTIVADSVGEVIRGDAVYPCEGKVIIR